LRGFLRWLQLLTIIIAKGDWRAHSQIYMTACLAKSERHKSAALCRSKSSILFSDHTYIAVRWVAGKMLQLKKGAAGFMKSVLSTSAEEQEDNKK